MVALVWASSPWSEAYEALARGRPWVNAGLMPLFFFVVGLELKRELVHGSLRDRRASVVPVAGAAGGMVVPALVYLVVSRGHEGVAHGWGIPMATDIAFAIGVVSLLGSRVPASLKLFLLTLAVVDDIGAIVVIAVVYAGDGLAGHVGVVGVVLGMLVPARPSAVRLERFLHPWTSFVVLPLFALANAGVNLRGSGLAGGGPAAVATAVAAGLVLGKAAGITGAVWLAVRSGQGRLPDGATWPMVVAVATVGGVGFTVALFVAELAFAPGPFQDAAKVGVLAGSAVAALAGVGILHRACPRL